VIASLLCGLANSMGMLVVARALQGFVAGPMYPITQALLISIYPPRNAGRRSRCWRWSPWSRRSPARSSAAGSPTTTAGNGSSSSTCRSASSPALVVGRQLKRPAGAAGKPKMDYVGLITLVIGVGALQILLDLGNDEDWFNSTTIVALAIVSAIALAVFLIWELTDKDPIVNLRLFRHRNFAPARWRWWWPTAAFFSVGLLVPLWLQRNLGYTAIWAGTRDRADRHPAGAADALRRQVRRPLRHAHARHDRLHRDGADQLLPRSGFNLDVDFARVAWVQLFQGLGVALFFMPVLTDPAVGPGGRTRSPPVRAWRPSCARWAAASPPR
jgi:DHA2 family multidrug resistance protein